MALLTQSPSQVLLSDGLTVIAKDIPVFLELCGAVCSALPVFA